MRRWYLIEYVFYVSIHVTEIMKLVMSVGVRAILS